MTIDNLIGTVGTICHRDMGLCGAEALPGQKEERIEKSYGIVKETEESE
jgi:hypothetical protein